jgi:membrane protein DedA with SNARE-associated domain
MDAALAFLDTLQGAPAYGLVFVLLVLCGIGAPINEDIVLFVAAALTLKGVMDPVPLMVVAWFGLIVGDGLVFHWAHRFGAPLLRTRFFARILPPQRLSALASPCVRWQHWLQSPPTPPMEVSRCPRSPVAACAAPSSTSRQPSP